MSMELYDFRTEKYDFLTVLIRINKDMPGFIRNFKVFFVFIQEQPDNIRIMAINCQLKGALSLENVKAVRHQTDI